MMVLRAAIVVAAATLFAVAASAAGPESATTSRVLLQGPELAGDAVVWGESDVDGHPSLHLWSERHGDRTVYSNNSLSLGTPVAASRTLLAFERSYPSCPPQPGYVCPQASDALVGPPRGPFRALVQPSTCSAGWISLAVDEVFAGYVQTECTRDLARLIVRDVLHRGRPVVLREAPAWRCCGQLALAGRYVAWSSGNRVNGNRSVVVYDRLVRRVAYRVPIQTPAGHSLEMDFDLQPDGKVAVAYRFVNGDTPPETGETTIAWSSPSEPRTHVLPLRGRTTLVRIAHDGVALERYLTPRRSSLVVTDLHGRVQRVARLVAPERLRGFDFDGQRLVWASDVVTSTHEDCPQHRRLPPPCGKRETGLTRIWLRTDLTGPTRSLAALPFNDTIAKP
jgi:hypothetical protein